MTALSEAVKVRKATKEDYELLCRLRRELVIYQNKINPDNKADDRKLESSDDIIKTYLERDYSVFFIAFDGEAVGFAHGTIDPKPQEHIQAYIQELYVREDHRRKGIGTALLTELEKYFGDNVAGASTDEDNKETIEFYEKRGYVLSEVKDKVAYLIKKQ